MCQPETRIQKYVPVYPLLPAQPPPTSNPTPIHHHSILLVHITSHATTPHPPSPLLSTHLPNPHQSPSRLSPLITLSSLYLTPPRAIHTPTASTLTTTLHESRRYLVHKFFGGIGAVVMVYSIVVGDGERVTRRGVEVVKGYIFFGP